ncbi:MULTISPECIES: signal recognition particle-docking protein FtsY [Thermodesulfobacterium]|jgi:fused signal recognition particle receptor|uniref:Signal recognition particle receptor FtsY n=1 Tax=Thermodesulfobacterium commune TaxID=1741 RepID=A0A3B8N8D2_9BACT|nr:MULTISPECIES: signal recognition particle-docking protein FtsY [Thermodesulfobacterium]KUJ97524.1 MAG: Signal recognition particle receptor FtsY [Thermodesulfobacterium sp. 37_54]HAA83741.1 signal recognition particle-docking protein FtsY [Thermodesulfobacterium commune]MBZ4681255.1 ftsY [Thermodesulfobacterium sp.]MDK2861580.1 fused signal recognition particle receptor [Thermodesulfobacterium sp.]MDN5380473.1 fused signal recognition particle receptor [Thermodesulfobacterium sp.]
MFNFFKRKKEEKREAQEQTQNLITSSQEAPQPEPEEEKSGFLGFFKKENLIEKFKKGLSKTKEKLSEALSDLFEVERVVDLKTLEEIEENLILSDLGVETTLALIEPFKDRVINGETLTTKELKKFLKSQMLSFLKEAETPFPPQGHPSVLFFLGVNGVGKTTTIAKIGKKLKENGFSVVLVAADTFRAAAIDQLKTWGERISAPVIALQEGSDPAAVIYQGIEYAKKNNIDVVLVDTAGRLHTKYNLIEELKKMVRVMHKLVPPEACENILVLDATTGQNALSQAKHFTEAVPVHSVIITKMDGTAKGGIAIALSYQFNLPIRFIGLGEKAEDLVPFNKESFVDAILPD